MVTSMPASRRNAALRALSILFAGVLPSNALASGAGPSRDASAARNPAGAALLARVVGAYEHVPAAVLVERSGSTTLTFTQILKHNTVVSELLVARAAGATTVLVVRHGPPTYAKEPGTSCWRVLPKSSGQNLTDVGRPFLTHLFTLAGLAIDAPRRTSTGWVLTVSQAGATLHLAITRSLLLRRMIGTQSGQRVDMDIENRATVPGLPTTTPRC